MTTRLLASMIVGLSIAATAGACAQKSVSPMTGAAAGNQTLASPTRLPHPQASDLVVRIDPVTGQILPKPPGLIPDQLLVPQQLGSTPTSTPQLTEEPSATPAGGVKVHLKRQFLRPLFATRQKDGRIKIEHRPGHDEPDAE